MLRRWLLLVLCTLLLLSCGEPVPVDCTPDEEQCTSETEGGFETGPVAGIAAGGAAVVALAGGGLGGSEDGGSSSSSQSGASNTNQNTPKLTGTLLDSAVGGVSYTTSSNLSGLTNTNGQFEYRSGDQVTFSIGDTVLGKVNGGAVVTPVELAGTNNTADRRVINISRLLQSLDQDGDPTNGISVNPATRSMLAQQAFKFDIPVTEFQLRVNPFIENILKRPIVNADEAINHLHGSLNLEGRPGSIGSQDDIRQLVPGFVAVTPDNVPSNQPSNTTQFNCNFAGGTVPDKGSVIAYQSPNVAADRMEQPYNEWGTELYAEFPEERLKAVHWARYLIAVHLSFALFAVLIGYPILILIVSLHPFIGNWLRYFVGSPMHCGLRSDVSDFRKCVRTITLDPISEFLYWHMNWHLEHHMFAAVPCYNLKKLHEAVTEDMPKSRTLISSWQEMLAVVKQQETDPAYEFDTPVPPQRTRKEKEQQLELEASIGDLAPTAIA